MSSGPVPTSMHVTAQRPRCSHTRPHVPTLVLTPPPTWCRGAPFHTDFKYTTPYLTGSLNTLTLKSTLILWTPSAGAFCLELLPLERVLRVFRAPAFSCLLTGGGFSYRGREK